MKDQYRVTGLMSGSSMDGVDLACCDFKWDGEQWAYHIIEAETFPYEDDLRRKLAGACNLGQGEIFELDLELGNYFADLLNAFHRKTDLHPDLISSHGHTILHDPPRGITFQAGNGRVMAEKTGITVINDFRSEDVAQGGQGAPLVPLGDRLLFKQYEGCLNLGGFANISFEGSDGTLMAYDLCPANMALNSVAVLEGLDYDKNGEMARNGRPDAGLLGQLNHLDFYAADPPKSLGREWFLEKFHPLIINSGLNNFDLMATVLEHIARQISAGINRIGTGSILVTGGGALNRTLIERLGYYTKASLVIPEKRLIHFKEALIFALLGVLRSRGEINCLASVTGGREDLSAGTIHRI